MFKEDGKNPLIKYTKITKKFRNISRPVDKTFMKPPT